MVGQVITGGLIPAGSGFGLAKQAQAGFDKRVTETKRQSRAQKARMPQ
jgi:hypothetical protein